MPPLVSIIIPAHNAHATLPATVASVRAQTTDAWEAIIIDDGSADATLSTAQALAATDARIRTLTQANRGASAARNAGLARARAPWILFLDADDELAPRHLETLLDAANRHPGAALLHGGAQRKIGGALWPAEPAAALHDAFRATATGCPFFIHAALTKRDAIAAVGGFDESLRTCEDWDLWQRIARAGAIFAPAVDVIAIARAREGSLSSDLTQLLADALTVIRRGHAADPRAATPDPAYAQGAPASECAAAIWRYGAWIAGARIGQGGDPMPLMDSIAEPVPFDVDVHAMAENLLAGLSIGAGAPRDALARAWPRFRQAVFEATAWFERRTGVSYVGKRMRNAIDARLAAATQPQTHSLLNALRLQPIDLLSPPTSLNTNDAKRVRIQIFVGAQAFNAIEALALGSFDRERIIHLLTHCADDEAFNALLQRRSKSLSFWTALVRSFRKGVIARTMRDAALGKINFHGVSGFTSRAELMAFKRVLLGETAHGPTPANPAAAIIAQERPQQSNDEAHASEAESPSPVGAYGSEAYWEAVFSRPDPWGYTNAYESVKYDQTLSLITPLRAADALEIACAEGEFTQRLAPHVVRLKAVDISPTALKRAAEKCAAHKHVTFGGFNLLTDAIDGAYDLIVCSEVLYYAPDRDALSAFAAKVAQALKPGGSLVMAHANLLIDEPHKTGFVWPHAFGAKGIGDIFAAQGDLALAEEIHTPLYRVQRFQKAPASTPPLMREEDAAIDIAQRVSAQVVWRGGETQKRAPAWNDFTTLMYHRIADDGPPTLAQWRLSPEKFAAQLRWLRDNGFTGITLDDVDAAFRQERYPPPRAVLITFDDATTDFKTAALPLLHRYGFPATLFAPVAHVGGAAAWDSAHGAPAPLLDWDALRALETCDVRVAAHGFAHAHLTALAPEDLIRDLARARFSLEQALKRDVTAIAYPFGDVDPLVRDAAAACGYSLGFTCFPGRVTPSTDRLMIPRQEVAGDLDIERFAALFASR